MKEMNILDNEIQIEARIEDLYRKRYSEEFFELIQNNKNVNEVLLPFIEESLACKDIEKKRMVLNILIRLKLSSNISLSLIERIVETLESGSIVNMSLGVRCLIEIVKKTKISGSSLRKIVEAISRFFTELTAGLSSKNITNEVRKGVLLSSEPVFLLLLLAQASKEEMSVCGGTAARALCGFCMFFVQNSETAPQYLSNESIKLQCITTLTQIISWFMSMMKGDNAETHALSGFLPDLTVFLLDFCPDDAVSIKKSVYEQLSMLKFEKKRVLSGYSETILKEGILLRPKSHILKLLGLTLSTEFLVMFRDSTHRVLSLKVCREAVRILMESQDHSLNKLCVNVLVQVNDTIIGDSISVGEKGFFIRTNYLAFLNAFKKYAEMPVTEETKNVLRSVIRGMKNTMHYFSLFQNIPSNMIVFSLKCFTPAEISELSVNLGKAFRLFSLFDLEKKSDIIIVCEFLLIFFYLDAALFDRILAENVELLFSLTKSDKAMFAIWRQFLAYGGVVKKFAAVVVRELLKIVHVKKEREFVVQAFREIFSTFAVHRVETEGVVTQYLQEIFEKCLIPDENLGYTVEIVKDLFRAIGKERLEVLSKELALSLPLFFSKLERLRRLYPESADHVELSLTVPVKISVLLPFLGQIAKSVVLALQMKNALSILAIELLEMCVDNLNSDFLTAYLGEELDSIFVALVDLVQHEESSVMAIKMLGKLSGKARNTYYPSCRGVPSSVFLTVNIPGATDLVDIPADKMVLAGAEVLRAGGPAAQKEEVVLVAGLFFSKFFSWCTLEDAAIESLCRDIEVVHESNFEKLHKFVNSSEFKPKAEDLSYRDTLAPTEIPSALISALIQCASEGVVRKGDEVKRVVEGEGAVDAEAEAEGGSVDLEGVSHIEGAKKLLHSIYGFITVVKILELVRFEEYQRKIKADTVVFIEELAKAFGKEETETVAQEILSRMYSVAVRMCGSKEKTSQMTLFYTILHTFCSMCYSNSDTDKLCGIKGVVFITQQLNVGTNWLLYQEIRVVKALFSSLVSSRYDHIEVVREAIFHILRTTHNPAEEADPAGSEHFTQLILCFAQELSHPYEKIRRISKECLEHSAELFGSDVTTFLLPISEKITVQILNKPLRALPTGVQIGNMDVMTYLFGLRPPLLKMEEKIERFIGEAFRVVASPNSTLELREGAVRLFVAAAVSPGFTSPQFLMKISQVLIKGLFAKEKGVVEVCKDGLRQMYLQGKETPRDVLQSWLLPVVNSFAQKKIAAHVVAGLVYLQELDQSLLKHGLAITILDILGKNLPETDAEEIVDMCFRVFSKVNMPLEGEFVTNATVLYVHFFKTAKTKDLSRGFKMFVEAKSGVIGVLFRMCNEDDDSYYITMTVIREVPSVKAIGRMFMLSSQGTWRQYVVLDAFGYVFNEAQIEKGLEIWRESVSDLEFQRVLVKYLFTSVRGFLAYYGVEEAKILPACVPREKDAAKKGLAMFIEAVRSAEILRAPEGVQRRLLRTYADLVQDKSVLCVEGPALWKIAVAEAVLAEAEKEDRAIRDGGKDLLDEEGSDNGNISQYGNRKKTNSGGEEASESDRAISAFLRGVLEVPEIGPVDAIRITAYLIENGEEDRTDAFIPLITAHPEYSEFSIRGIVALLRRIGPEPFLETISSVLDNETLYRTHLHIVLPAISAVPEMFVRSGIEPVACSMAQRLFLNGHTRLAVSLFRSAMVWRRAGTVSNSTVGFLLPGYVSYYIHTKSAVLIEGVERLPFDPNASEQITVINEKLSPGNVSALYTKSARAGSKISEVLKPVLKMCFREESRAEEMRDLLAEIAEVDKEYLLEIFNVIPDSPKALRTIVACASLIGSEFAVERALTAMEEGLAAGGNQITPEVLSECLILGTSHPSSSILPMLAQILSRRPEVFRYPEAAECAVSIMHSPEVSLLLKQNLLMSMNSEEFQEIRLGLVYTIYLDSLVRKGEAAPITPGLQGLFVRGLLSPSHKIRNDFFRVFDEGVPADARERVQYLFQFDWELFKNDGWVSAFSRMLLALSNLNDFSLVQFWSSDEDLWKSTLDLKSLLSGDVISADALEETSTNAVSTTALSGATTPGTTAPTSPKSEIAKKRPGRKPKNAKKAQEAGASAGSSPNLTEDTSGAGSAGELERKEAQKVVAQKAVIRQMLIPFVNGLRKHGKLSRETLKNAISSLLYNTNEGSRGVLKALLSSIIKHQPEKIKENIHSRAEEMLIKLGQARTPNMAVSSEPVLQSIGHICRAKPYLCRVMEVAQSTGSWTTVAETLEGKKSSSLVYLEIEEKDYLLAQLRVSAIYPETVRALTYQQIGKVKTAQSEYEEIQAKAQSGALLFNEEEYKTWKEQWIECASYLQQWDLLSEIGAATKDASLVAKSKWYTTDFSIEAEKAAFKAVLEEVPQQSRAFYDLFIVGDRTPETEESLYRIVSSTIEEISKFPKLSPRQLSAVEKFQIVVEMNESWQLNGSEETKKDLVGIFLAWKERMPCEWSSLAFWSMVVKWRTHVFSSLWNSSTKEKALQYRGYHETAHILNLFSKTLRKHSAHPAALSNLESIYTLPNIEISDAYMKLEEHAKCYLEMEEYSAGLDLLGMTNLNYFTAAQKSGVFLLRGELLEKKGQLEETAKIYAQAVQVHPTNAKAWYRWGALSRTSSPSNAISAFVQAAAISSGHLARKAVAGIVSLMDGEEKESEEAKKAFENSIGEIDAWHFIPFVHQMVAMVGRTGSQMAMSALYRVARIYPQAVYFPVRTALEAERKKGVEGGPIADLWTFLKTGFTLMCINIEGIVESLTLRLRCSAEEEFYRLVCALLSEALQQLFGKEPPEANTLSVAITKISKMIGMSSLAAKYKENFDKEFEVAMRGEGLGNASKTWEIAQVLLHWKGALERVLGVVPKRLSMENISRRLIDFEQKSEDIEMFGQYIDIKDRAPQIVKISRFEPEILIERKAGISLRRISIRGNNGVVYKVALQIPSGGSARREERFIQVLSLINTVLLNSIEMQKRGAKIGIKKIVALNQQTRIILEEEESVCFGKLLEEKMGKQKVFEFIFKCRKMMEKEGDQRGDPLDAERRMKMFTKATEEIDDEMLYGAFMERYSTQDEFFYFRKRVAVSHALHCLLAYVFGIGSRMPSRMFVGTTSGSILSTEFYPSHLEKPSVEEVPFRMTPNIQKLIGRAGLEGPFLSTMYHFATLLDRKEYLKTYVHALVREDVGEEVAERCTNISKSKVKELIASEESPAKGIIRLVGNATSPERLSMMDPQWHPWF